MSILGFASEDEFNYADGNALNAEYDYVGGVPLFVHKAPPSALIRCCKEECREADVMFLMRLYAPFENSKDIRVLYVFLCTNCEEIFVLRQVLRPPEVLNAKVVSQRIESSSKKHDIDNWLIKDTSTNSINDLSSLLDGFSFSSTKPKAASKAKDSDNTEKTEQKQLSDFIIIAAPERCGKLELPAFYIDTEAEEERKQDLTHAQKLLEEYQKQCKTEGLTQTKNEEWSGEAYEKPSVDFYTKERDRFIERVGWNPYQILRYGGQALLYSPEKSLIDKFGKCSVCECPLKFEFQIMPGLMSFYSSLKATDDKYAVALSRLDELSFGTVLVYSCANNCTEESDTSYVEADGWLISFDKLKVLKQEE